MFKLLTAEKAFSRFKYFLQVFLSLREIKLLNDAFFKNEESLKRWNVCALTVYYLFNVLQEDA